MEYGMDGGAQGHKRIRHRAQSGYCHLIDNTADSQLRAGGLHCSRFVMTKSDSLMPLGRPEACEWLRLYTTTARPCHSGL